MLLSSLFMKNMKFSVKICLFSSILLLTGPQDPDCPGYIFIFIHQN